MRPGRTCIFSCSPPTEYPQNQPWFQSFAGSAFQLAGLSDPARIARRNAGRPVFFHRTAAPRVFSVVVPETRDAVVGFTRGGA